MAMNRGIEVVTGLSLLVLSCACSESFTLHFPETSDLGELWLIEDVNCFTCGTGQEYLGRATGTINVTLPAPHWYVSLRMPEASVHLLPHLSHPSLVNVGEINLNDSDVGDEDLSYIASINLQSIGLAGTAITGEGLRYLRPNDDWIFVDLRECKNLDPRYLSHFKGWKRSTISVTSRGWSTAPLSKADSMRMEEARFYICDDQPEEICHTQIR